VVGFRMFSPYHLEVGITIAAAAIVISLLVFLSRIRH